MLERWTRLVLAHRWLTLGVWCALLAASICTLPGLARLLTNHIALPGTDSERAEIILDQQFGQRSVGSFTLVAKTRGGPESLAADLAAVTDAARRAVAELPSGKLIAVRALGDDVFGAWIISSLESADAKRHIDAMRASIGTSDGMQTYLTGVAATEHDLDPILQRDLYTGELLIALPIAIVLLIWTFRTLAFVVPLILASFTIPTTLGLVWVIANIMELTTYVTNLVSLIGLGIAVDYSLLVVHRFREEFERGASADEAMIRTIETAGRAVVISGMAVAIGLALLLFMPLPFLRGFGVGGLLIPIVSVAASLTLLPVLLVLAGRCLDRLRIVPGSRSSAAGPGDFWSIFSCWIMRRALPVATGSAALLLLIAAPALDLELGPGSSFGQPSTLESIQGLKIITEAVGAGATTPTSIVIDSGRASGMLASDVSAALRELLASLANDPEVSGILFDAGRAQHVEPTGRYANVLLFGRSEFGAAASLDLVARLRDIIIPAAGFPGESKVLVGGAPAAGSDFLRIVIDWFPLLVVAVLGVSYVLLLRAFRSLLLPLKAVIMNVLSIGAAAGLSVAVFNWGWGIPLGLIGAGQVEAWIPVMVFAMLFGLSMDYEVFLVSRMREEWDNGASNDDAVAAGLTMTGRLVTSAGLIMCAAFTGFVAGSIVALQQFGFALAVAILLDVTIVRALLLPATMKLFGRWNWYLPAVVASWLHVPPSPLRERQFPRGPDTPL